MNDGDLALSFLRRLCSDRFALVAAEDGSALLDTGYVTTPEEEVDLLRRLLAEAEAATPQIVTETHYDGPVRIPIVPWAKDA